jgi:hypothetical protein
MSSKFKANVERHKRISLQLEKHGLEFSAGCVIDNKMPCHKVVCQGSELVDTDNDFLKANTVIAQHLDQRESKIQKHKDEQAEAHAWVNRPL